MIQEQPSPELQRALSDFREAVMELKEALSGMKEEVSGFRQEVADSRGIVRDGGLKINWDRYTPDYPIHNFGQSPPRMRPDHSAPSGHSAIGSYRR